jgi:hypothetical protein
VTWLYVLLVLSHSIVSSLRSLMASVECIIAAVVVSLYFVHCSILSLHVYIIKNEFLCEICVAFYGLEPP